MGIASSVLWIMFGLLYILYQAFKEHPAETIGGILQFAATFVGMLASVLFLNFLVSIDEMVGSLIAVVFIWLGIWHMCRQELREARRYEESAAEYERAMKLMDEGDTSAYDALVAKEEEEKRRRKR